MEQRDQFTFYRSFWEALKALPKKDQLPFVMAVCSYAFGEESKPITGHALASFLLVKPILEKASKKAANGKRGGRKPKANEKQTESKPEANEKQTGSNIEIEGEKEVEVDVEGEIENECSLPLYPPQGGNAPVKQKKGKTPTVDEVREYCQLRKNGIDPEAFVDFYTARGWKYGQGKPVVDWQAAVRTWEKRRGCKQADALPKDRKAEIEENDAWMDSYLAGGGDAI